MPRKPLVDDQQRYARSKVAYGQFMARCPSNCTERQKKKQKTIFITFIAMPQLFCQRSRWRGTKGKAGAKMGKGQKMTRRMRAKDTKGATRASLNSHLWGRLRGQVRPECGKLLGFWNQRKLISKDIHSICNDLNSKWVEFLDRGGFMLYEDPSRYRFS